jgi:hypothetical protein
MHVRKNAEAKFNCTTEIKKMAIIANSTEISKTKMNINVQ